MTIPTIRVTWAFPPDLYDALTAEASHEGVSMTAHGIGKLNTWDGLLEALREIAGHTCDATCAAEGCECRSVAQATIKKLEAKQ